jgi:type II restriction enzyme
MDLQFRPELAAEYKSLSQIARVLTEAWAGENLYCAACKSDYLDPAPTGKRVIDFTCPDCEEQYQLKSQSHPFGYRVTNSAYGPKMEKIRKGTNPNYLFLHYSPQRYRVLNLFLVPRHFMTPGVIEKRKELSQSARRRGWVGSNILLGQLPIDARIPIIENESVRPRSAVRRQWGQFLFLRDQRLDSRGWLSDVLACVRELDREFTLDEVYAFEERLAALHPRNRHIRPKIRQQLQVLRDKGIIEFLERGRYRVIK